MSVASKLISDFCGLTAGEKTSLIIPQNIKNPQIPKLGQNSDCFTEYVDESKKEAIRNAFPKFPNVQDLDDSNTQITKLRNAIANHCDNDCIEYTLYIMKKKYIIKLFCKMDYILYNNYIKKKQ